MLLKFRSNNTNKLSPQEPTVIANLPVIVQIIQINLVLKNASSVVISICQVQIIQINLVLKNRKELQRLFYPFK